MQWDNFFFGPVRLGEHVLADFQQWLDQLDEPFSTVHVLVDQQHIDALLARADVTSSCAGSM